MAALQRCLFPFSPAARSPAATSSPITSPPILPVGRRDRCLPRLTAAARPRLTVQAQNGGGDARPLRRPSAHLREESELVMGHYLEIISIDHGCLYAEATAMSARVCLSANDALLMASQVMHSAELSLAATNEISAETIHRTVRAYAGAFLDAGEDSYRRTVSRKTVVSFLGGLRGLAAVSRILLEGAVEALSHKLPRDSLTEYAFNSDVDAMYGEFLRQMAELEDELRTASATEICKVALPIILAGTAAAESIVGLMVARRKRALQKAHDKLAA